MLDEEEFIVHRPAAPKKVEAYRLLRKIRGDFGNVLAYYCSRLVVRSIRNGSC